MVLFTTFPNNISNPRQQWNRVVGHRPSSADRPRRAVAACHRRTYCNMGQVGSTAGSWFNENLSCTANRKPPVEEASSATPSLPLTDEEKFEAAVQRYKAWNAAKLPKDKVLYLYALRKQAVLGDVEGSRPPVYHREERAKWDAWAKLEHDLSMKEAKAKFVRDLGRLMQTYGSKE